MTDVILRAWVPGVPRTKGSLDRRMQDTPQSKAWRRHVATTVRRAMNPNHWELSAIVDVHCQFWLPGDPHASGAGDVDKLLRNVLDAIGCTRNDDAHLIADDNMVRYAPCVKYECDPKIGPGLWLVVTRVPAMDVEQERAGALVQLHTSLGVQWI